jgi:hypothetical protein
LFYTFGGVSDIINGQNFISIGQGAIVQRVPEKLHILLECGVVHNTVLSSKKTERERRVLTKMKKGKCGEMKDKRKGGGER